MGSSLLSHVRQRRRESNNEDAAEGFNRSPLLRFAVTLVGLVMLRLTLARENTLWNRMTNLHVSYTTQVKNHTNVNYNTQEVKNQSTEGALDIHTEYMPQPNSVSEANEERASIPAHSYTSSSSCHKLPEITQGLIVNVDNTTHMIQELGYKPFKRKCERLALTKMQQVESPLFDRFVLESELLPPLANFFNQHRVVLVGDSLTRQHFEMLADRLNFTQHWYHRNSTPPRIVRAKQVYNFTFDKFGSGELPYVTATASNNPHCIQLEHFKLRHLVDRNITQAVEFFLEENDVVIFNFGLHYRTPTNKTAYEQDLPELLEACGRINTRTKKRCLFRETFPQHWLPLGAKQNQQGRLNYQQTLAKSAVPATTAPGPNPLEKQYENQLGQPSAPPPSAVQAKPNWGRRKLQQYQYPLPQNRRTNRTNLPKHLLRHARPSWNHPKPLPRLQSNFQRFDVFPHNWQFNIGQVSKICGGPFQPTMHSNIFETRDWLQTLADTHKVPLISVFEDFREAYMWHAGHDCTHYCQDNLLWDIVHERVLDSLLIATADL